MCVRKENEPLMVYWFRQLVEKPWPVVVCCCMVSMVYLYQDVREMEIKAAEINFKTSQELGNVAGQLLVMNQHLSDLKQFHREDLKK